MVMPHYNLHIRHDGELIEDPDGFDFADLAAAEVEVLEALRDILVDAIRERTRPLADMILIVDESGHELASMSLAQALPSKLRPI